MKIGHFGLWAPKRSGLYEFIKDQIKYERRAGLESLFFHSDDSNPDPNRFTDPYDDGVTAPLVASNYSEIESCDVIVLHRSIPWEIMHGSKYKHISKMAVLHGTSEIMVLHEIESAGANAKFDMHIGFLDEFEKVITITKNDTYIMKLYDKHNKVEYINDAVDLEHYSPADYKWPYRYHPSIISTTNIRINKNPAPLIWAMPEIMKEMHNARLNLFCLSLTDISTWRNIVLKSGILSVSIEHMQNQFFELRPFMRGADIGFNSNYSGIFSRDSMEQMGCGLSVVAYSDEHTPYVCQRDPYSITRAVKSAWDDIARDPEKQIAKNRAYAEEHFCMEKAVKKYIKVYEDLRRGRG